MATATNEHGSIKMGMPPHMPHPEITLEPWQYRLTATPHPEANPVGDFWLSVGPDLPVTEVTDHQGRKAGVLLGFPIDLDRASLVGQHWQTPSDADLSTDAGINRCLLALGGRFLWICLTETVARIYPDAGTQVSCVWDRSLQSVGATTLAILGANDYAARFDHAQFARLGLAGEGWFPAGLTAHSGVSRLLPNHYIDLHQWQAHRFDPCCSAVATNATPDDIVEGTIAAIQSQIIAVMSGPKKAAFALTAGYETRTLLACARQWTDDITFVTVVGQDRHRTDSVLAQQIATGFGLDHQTLPRVEATRTAQERYLRRGGHCSGDSNLRYHPSIAPIAKDYVFVGGAGGEIGRAFYQDDTDTPDMQITARLLMSRMGMRGTDKSLRYLRLWLEELEGQTNERIFDLAYLENRVGPWAMAQFCADPTLVRHAPMITYRTVALMQALPMTWKQSNRLNKEIISRLWPELHRYPYNTLGPLKDLIGHAQRVMDDPALVIKKIRKRLA